MSATNKELNDIFSAPQKQEKAEQQTDNRPQWKKDQQELKNTQYKVIEMWTENIQKDPQVATQYFQKQSDILNYSPSNVMLILSQCPTATLVKDFNNWKEQGYSLKGKQDPINIIERGNKYAAGNGSMRTAYNPKRVYDISQTTAEGQVKPQTYPVKQFLSALVKSATVAIKPTNQPEYCGEKQDAFFDEVQNCVYVNSNQDFSNMCVATLRELSHASFARDNETYTRENEMFAAEYSASLVAQKIGIESKGTGGNELVAHFKDQDLQGVRDELGKIQSTAKFLHSRAERYLATEKLAQTQQEKQKQQGAR